MSPSVPNPRVLFAKSPGDDPVVPGVHIVYDSTQTINLEQVPLQKGQWLTKTLFLSPEPALRERMRDPSIPSYTPTFKIGAPIIGFGVVIVLRSENDTCKKGDIMFGQTPWEAYTVQPYTEGRVIIPPLEERKKDPNNKWPVHIFDMDSLALRVVPAPPQPEYLSSYCNILGTPGLSAFVGFEGLADGKKGEKIFVSSGASGVGSMVIQLAKMKGMEVIASSSSQAKLDYMKSIGADHVFNYKQISYDAALKKFGPIDVYWDNVGGEALEAAIEHLTLNGRAICCGSSEDYDKPINERYGIKNTTEIFKKRLKLQGFLVPDLMTPELMGKFLGNVPNWVGTGVLRSLETVTEGLENAPNALLNMLKGNEGKAGKPVIRVAKYEG